MSTKLKTVLKEVSAYGSALRLARARASAAGISRSIRRACSRKETISDGVSRVEPGNAASGIHCGFSFGNCCIRQF